MLELGNILSGPLAVGHVQAEQIADRIVLLRRQHGSSDVHPVCEDLNRYLLRLGRGKANLDTRVLVAVSVFGDVLSSMPSEAVLSGCM